MKQSKTEFIPAQESRWFIFIFDLYMRSLFWRRFKNVWVDQEYQPSKTSKTIYYLNHTSWWDGLIPLLLNRKLFRQNARAMMEDKQMREHGLFKRIGAFSVNLENPRSAVRSLRYAAESMKRENSSLFIYPEGKIYPFTTKNIQFRDGLAWIANRVQDADVVPIGIYFTTANYDKPELFLKIGKPVEFNSETDRPKLKALFEDNLESLLEKLESQAHDESFRFDKI
ncbi:MAG: lysophospholipid acyltransferase family protein [Balneolaceae bacterium]|nr:lysophospholipid acyltransferase family protein [Balneolaceae bacterium]